MENETVIGWAVVIVILLRELKKFGVKYALSEVRT